MIFGFIPLAITSTIDLVHEEVLFPDEDFDRLFDGLLEGDLDRDLEVDLDRDLLGLFDRDLDGDLL
jgi:hypothetical protein